MNINTLTYFIKDAMTSIRRNSTTSLASIVTVVITFFIFGACSLFTANIDSSIKRAQNNFEINISLVEGISQPDQNEIKARLESVDGVVNVKFSSREEEFEKMKKQFGEQSGVLAGYNLQNNPCYDAYIVKLKSMDYAAGVYEVANNLTGVLPGNDQTNAIEDMQKVNKVIKGVEYGIFVVLLIVSVCLIMNTTKITVYSRRKEVSIMKFVGATDWFIRWPFIIEGIVIALIGTFVSLIVLFLAYNGLTTLIANNAALMSFIKPSYIFTHLSWQFMLWGIGVGSVSSIIALRKFLVV